MNSQGIKQINLFLNGVKPALLFGNSRKENQFLLENGYPYIENKKNKIFFKNEKWKERFLRFNKSEKGNINDKLIGLFLGFPFHSIYAFGNVSEEEKVLIDYHGICFITSINTLEKDLNWLKDKYENKIPQSLQSEIRIGVIDPKGNPFITKFLLKKLDDTIIQGITENIM